MSKVESRKQFFSSRYILPVICLFTFSCTSFISPPIYMMRECISSHEENYYCSMCNFMLGTCD